MCGLTHVCTIEQNGTGLFFRRNKINFQLHSIQTTFFGNIQSNKLREICKTSTPKTKQENMITCIVLLQNNVKKSCQNDARTLKNLVLTDFQNLINHLLEAAQVFAQYRLDYIQYHLLFKLARKHTIIFHSKPLLINAHNVSGVTRYVELRDWCLFPKAKSYVSRSLKLLLC